MFYRDIDGQYLDCKKDLGRKWFDFKLFTFDSLDVFATSI